MSQKLSLAPFISAQTQLYLSSRETQKCLSVISFVASDKMRIISDRGNRKMHIQKADLLCMLGSGPTVHTQNKGLLCHGFWHSPVSEWTALSCKLSQWAWCWPELWRDARHVIKKHFQGRKREVNGLNDENFRSLNKVPTFPSCPKCSQQTLWSRNWRKMCCAIFL